jgi:hypothetical protein
MRMKDLAGDVESVMQVSLGRFEVQLGPAQLEQPFTMKPMARRECHQLDKRGSLSTPPGFIRNSADVYRNLELAEQGDA